MASKAEKRKRRAAEVAKRSRVTAEDQLGVGAAKRITRKVEQNRQTKDSRLDSIMSQIRKAQSTDAHQ